MPNLYMTDYGEVCVSGGEMAVLQYADALRQWPDRCRTRPGRKLLAKARSIHEACVKFAKFKAGVDG